MTDLIERLRHPYPEIAGLAADEAADRIEALTADNERLREEVQALTNELAYHGIYPRPLTGKAE